jgi:hypothetical protein
MIWLALSLCLNAPQDAPDVPAPPPPPSSTEEEFPAPPPPPPVIDEALNDWRAQRKGFHWSLGAGAMAYPSSTGPTTNFIGFVAAVPSAAWSFGWLEAHLSLQVLGYLSSATKAVFVALDPQLRINFTRWYSLGVGPYLGVAMSPGVAFALGASLSPAIFKLGSRGEHEIAAWGCYPFALDARNSNVILLLLSYSYVFI